MSWLRKNSLEQAESKLQEFDILLTVQLSIFISVFNQLDVQNLFHNKLYFIPLHVSSTCAHHQEVIIALHSLCYHHTYRWPSRARVETVLSQPVHETATYRCDYQRLCNAIMTSRWWAHVLETCRGMKWNLLWNKFCASSWLNTEIKLQEFKCSEHNITYLLLSKGL